MLTRDFKGSRANSFNACVITEKKGLFYRSNRNLRKLCFLRVESLAEFSFYGLPHSYVFSALKRITFQGQRFRKLFLFVRESIKRHV